MKSKVKPCQTCASIDPNLSSRQNAKRLGISKTTVNNHLAAQMQGKHVPTSPTPTNPNILYDLKHYDDIRVPKPNTGSHTVTNPNTDNDLPKHDDFFTDIPQEIITSRGKSTRLADGSWEKISYQPNKMAIIEASRTTFEDLLPHLQDLKPPHTPQSSQSSHSPHTPHSLHTLHFNAADFQIGKAGQRGGGTPETLEKVRRALRKTTEQIRALPAHLRPDEIVVIDNGDPIENIFNTPQQAHTNDLNLADQIRTFRRLMLEILKAFIALKDDEYDPKITYVAVPSNHGEVRSGQGRGMRAGTTDADFGLEVQSQIEDAFELLQSEHPLVHFVRPEPGFSTAVHTTIDGTKVAYNHGHLSRGGQNGHGKWWASQDHGRLPGWDSDILVVAHYHNFRVEQSGNGRWIIGVSSPDPGSDWFTDSSGESAVSGITTFETSQGVWRNLQIV